MGDQASELDPGLIVIGGGLAETSLETGMDHVRAGFEEEHQHSTLIPPYPRTE